MNPEDLDPEEQFDLFIGLSVLFEENRTKAKFLKLTDKPPIEDISDILHCLRMVEEVSYFEANQRFERAGLDAEKSFKSCHPDRTGEEEDNICYNADHKTRQVWIMSFEKTNPKVKIYTGLLKDWKPAEA